ncbi:MAG TPA: bifunctional DNA-formamidopyrimidine glycosylase/DNA-(apurinic or apyrimidinic site) lyase [Desulfuromonadaceae bacterium]|nr:bifunctional DNA-formamidopyrimidine glycosylase/DNA-(apurinic or apyrimidinic site) lyase [Desulfuromonadaceae bacterium]
MPELPEVEVLARHLTPLVRGKTIRAVNIRRAKSLRPTSPREFSDQLVGATFRDLSRRGKYLIFELQSAGPLRGRQRSQTAGIELLGHLGMTGRMYVALKREPLPKHAAIVFDLGDRNFIYEDYRYFGRMSLDLAPIRGLGPEPLGREFTPAFLAGALKRSRQPVKVKLLDQTVAAGVGNIYASEALYRAGISPKLPASRLTAVQVKRLWRAIRETLREAIRFGSTVPLKFASGKSDGLFYFGRSNEGESFYEERLRVYDRGGQGCLKCKTPIRRITQAARSTFFCPECQKTGRD